MADACQVLDTHAAFPHPARGDSAADFRADPNAVGARRVRHYVSGSTNAPKRAPEAVHSTVDPVRITRPGAYRLASGRGLFSPRPPTETRREALRDGGGGPRVQIEGRPPSWRAARAGRRAREAWPTGRRARRRRRLWSEPPEAGRLQIRASRGRRRVVVKGHRYRPRVWNVGPLTLVDAGSLLDDCETCAVIVHGRGGHDHTARHRAARRLSWRPAMPLQNRVTPLGELVADPARGLVYGNRGCLHDAGGRIRRSHTGRRWIACRLQFRGWLRRPLLQPGRFTELFFLDEATAMAAGHRACALCRREDYNRLGEIWGRLHPGEAGADAIDARLHRERLAGRERRLPRRRARRASRRRVHPARGRAVARAGTRASALDAGRIRPPSWPPVGPEPRDHPAVARGRPAGGVGRRRPAPAPHRAQHWGLTPIFRRRRARCAKLVPGTVSHRR